MFRAFYPGTFDPPTLGHIHLIQRAANICDHLIVGVGKNAAKKTPILSVDERVEALKKATASLSNIEIAHFSGLAYAFAKHVGASVLVRGLRSSDDLAYEKQMAIANKRLSGIETIFLIAEDSATSISSTLIRELAVHGADLSAFIPTELGDILQHRIQKEE